MAEKREIVADLREQYGNVLSQNQVQQYLGMGDASLAEFLSGVSFMRSGRKKRFLAIDIARKIYEEQESPL